MLILALIIAPLLILDIIVTYSLCKMASKMSRQEETEWENEVKAIDKLEPLEEKNE